MKYTAVRHNKSASRYSITDLIKLFFINVLIIDPKAAHGVIAIGHTKNATKTILLIEKIKLFSPIMKPEAAILEIVPNSYSRNMWNSSIKTKFDTRCKYHGIIWAWSNIHDQIKRY